MRQAKKFIFLILLTCFLVSLYSGTQLHSVSRISAPFEEGPGAEPNTFSGYLLLMISLIIGFILYAQSAQQRFVYFSLLCLALIIFTFTLSRGGWVAAIPMLVTFIVLTKRKIVQFITIFVIIVVLFPFLIPQGAFKKVQGRVQETFSPFKTYKVFGKEIQVDESTSARIDSWKIGFEKWSQHPLLGYGIPASAVVDNQYMRVLVETGIIGFMAFMWIVVRLFKIGLNTYVVTRGDNFAQGLSIGFLAGLAGLLGHSLSAATFIIIRIMEPFWFIAAVVLSLPDIQEKEKELQYNE